MNKALCIHGHFYQPPREDPWLGEILPEGSAAPARHWNERIARESYNPLAFARRMDSQGKILEIINCYEWLSFNVGPTLLKWLETAEPATYERLLQADRISLERWGHGNALAQIYHHVILPLASPLHKELEIAWTLMDFEARFGRHAEGIWLSEAATDIDTLEALVDAGLHFTILSPHQAEAVFVDGGWHPLENIHLDISRPYLVELPSGRDMAVFFYDGPLSQAVAFEELLRDGEVFWNRLASTASSLPQGGLLTLATDGETYGHHFKFGEMALAYILEQACSQRDGLSLTNLATYLERHPPQQRVRIKSPSSWSCIHGVERWRADCGCTTGGHPGWSQKWRVPLRQAIDRLNMKLEEHFFSAGQGLFTDPKAALLNYGHVLAGSVTAEAFAASHMIPLQDASKQTQAWKLLAMEEWALAAQASCAWFFDEISRIEPLNALTFALRAADLARETGGPDLEQHLEQDLASARSNRPELGDGRELFRQLVLPRRESLTSLTAQALFRLWVEKCIPPPGNETEVRWDKTRVYITLNTEEDAETLAGKCRVSGPYDPGDTVDSWNWQRTDSQRPLAGRILVHSHSGVSKENSNAYLLEFKNLAWRKRQAIALRYAEAEAKKFWTDCITRAPQSIDLFQSRQEAQLTQNLEMEWTMLWASLAWGYIQGIEIDGEIRTFLCEFLKKSGTGHPEAQLLASRVAEEVVSCMEENPQQWSQALGIVRRSQELGLPLNLWAAQNHLWQHGIQGKSFQKKEIRELARELGFAGE